MAKINVLEKAVAELIAAGEVVERPASIVKELVENSIDAGATSITVEIQGGGIRMIRVTDNGCGIEAEDIPRAFLRHATSKVTTAEDLSGILTLGFRGEALASIAAMAKVELSTKTEAAPEGTRFLIQGGEYLESMPAGLPTGTTIAVRDVFYNTPARMKFLKTDVGEGNAVAQVVDKCALSHPEVAFRFIRDGQVKLSTSGNGSLSAVFRAIYGGELAAGLLEVDYLYDGMIRVTGCVSSPAVSRPSRAYQSYFINGRYVRSRTCSAALEEAFKGKLMGGRYPACALHLSILAETVDVNFHPAKIEVRFADERPVFSAVYYGVKTALASLETPVTAAPPSRKGQVTPLTLHLPKEQGVQQRLTAKEFQQLFGEKQRENDLAAERFRSPASLNASSLDVFVDDPGPAKKAHPVSPGYDQFLPRPPVTMNEPVLPEAENFLPEPPSLPVSQEEEKEPVASYHLVGELFGTYILLEQEKALVLVDKHAAHERMLYQQLLENLSHGHRQLLLAPVTVSLPKEEWSAVLEEPEAMEGLGFGVEDFGQGFLLVREVPLDLGEEDIAWIVGEIALRLHRGNRNLTPETLDRLYYDIACKSAIRAGDKTSPEELRELIRRLEENPSITHCPHGRPVSIRLSRREIEKMFGRIQ